MSSRSLILNKIKNTNVVEEIALPQIENFGEKYKSKIIKFQEMLKSVGGEGIVSNKNLNTIIKNLYPDAQNIFSNVDECELGNVNMADIKNPNELKDLDLAIVKGEFAVAENGAVWINNIDEIHRVTYFITQSLVVVINKDEVVKGLKEALVLGADNAIKSASAEDGFYTNKAIRIPFPTEAEKMKTTLQKAGMQSQITAFEKSLNAAAELATKEVFVVFVDAVASMSIKDAFAILKGDNTAATSYLRKQTNTQLYNKIKPIASKAIQQVEVTKYWNPLVKTYNTIPFIKTVNPDLEDYVTNKTIEGLFVLIANQEKEIRNNPKARTSALLQKVFK